MATCISRYIKKEDDKAITNSLNNYENTFRATNSYFKRQKGKCVTGKGILYTNGSNVKTPYECEKIC